MTDVRSGQVHPNSRCYQDLLWFPLTELVDNRDYPGSSHFLFDIGNGNLLAFVDFPRLDVGPYAEVLGGCTTWPSRWSRRGGRRSCADSTTPASTERSTVMCLSTSSNPDGARIELIADPLGEMYGHVVL